MTQRWDADAYARHARFVSDLGAPVVDLLDPHPGERILDLGCGDGVLTARLVAAGCRVVGVDSSPEQVWAALERGLDARVVDAMALPFASEFDAVFSNAVLHWLTDPDAVIAGVRRALRPGGRFVGEFGGAGCIQSVSDAFDEALGRRDIDARACHPWYFPTAEDYRGRLETGGFAVRVLSHFPRPTPLPGDLIPWLEIFAQAFVAAVPPSDRHTLLDEVRDLLRPRLCAPDGTWVVDYVRLRFAADKI